jgi:hypothetical protein
MNAVGAIARLAVWIFLSIVCAPALLAGEQPQSDYFRTSDGVNIHYLSLGQSGSFVVLVHAYGANAEGNWVETGIMQALAKNHRVLAIDCRNLW